jgi:ABC-type transport system involved in multi-copper enzyme maturation permease subunit
MLPGPVFNVELLTLARRKRYYMLRFFYGLLLLYLIWQNDPSLNRGYAVPNHGELTYKEMAWLGRAIFATFAFTQAIILLLITPAIVAGVIAEERQRKTLHYLLASCLSSGEIVLGKLAARLLHLSVFLAIGLPIIALLGFIGGVDPVEVPLLFAGCLTTAFLIAGFSMLVSVHAKRPREAVSLVYMMEMVWLIGPSLIQTFMPMIGGVWVEIYHWIKPLNDWIGASSPLFALVTSTFARFGGGPNWYQSVLWMAGLQVLYGTIFIVIAIARLRPINRAEGATGERVATIFSRRARRLLPRPECGDDALLWKERYVSRTSPLTKIASAFVFVAVVGLLSYVTYQFARPAFDDLMVRGYSESVYGSALNELNMYLRFVVTLTFGCWFLGTASLASGALTCEHEEDTWVSLIATPLSPSEIIRAKMVGVFWTNRWLGLIWILLVALGLVLGAIHPLGVAAAFLITAVYIWFACALGCFFSLRSRNSARSLTATIATLMLCNGVYLLLFLPFRMESSIRLMGVMPFVEACSLVSFEDVRTLLHGSTNFNRHFEMVDMAMTSAASVAAYAFAAFVLTSYLVLNFDDVIDRPRTNGGRRPPLRRFELPDDPPDRLPDAAAAHAKPSPLEVLDD